MSSRTDTAAAGGGAPSLTDEASLSAAMRRRVQRRKYLVLAGQFGFLVLWLGSWQIASDLNYVEPLFAGSPSGVVARLFYWFQHGTAYGSFWLQIAVTLEEAFLGFVFGVFAGVFVGILLGENAYLADVFGPYIKFSNALPRIVLGSIFVMWLGLGLPSKVVLAAVLVFFVVFFNAFQGVRSVDRNLVANIRILGGSRLNVVRHVVFPSAMSWIIASMHVALGLAIIGAIVGEYLGAQRGLGLVIKTAQNTFDANGVYGVMLVIGLIVLGAEAIMTFVERKLLAWQKPSSLNDIQGA